VRWMGLHPLRGYRLLGLTVRLMRDAASGLAPDRRSLFVLETRSAAAVYLRPLLQKRRRNRIQHRIASFLQWVATSLAARLPRRYPTLA
jgi:hypothetical protein